MLEREAAEKERKAAEDAYKAAIIARDQRAIDLDSMEKDCRKRLELACCKYNKALVRNMGDILLINKCNEDIFYT